MLVKDILFVYPQDAMCFDCPVLGIVGAHLSAGKNEKPLK